MGNRVTLSKKDLTEVIDEALIKFTNENVLFYNQLQGGHLNQTYKVISNNYNEYFLKIYITKEFDRNSIDSQIQILNHLHRHNIPVILPLTSLSGKHIQELTISSGSTFNVVLSNYHDNLGFNEYRLNTNSIRDIAQIQSKMHASLKTLSKKNIQFPHFNPIEALQLAKSTVTTKMISKEIKKENLYSFYSPDVFLTIYLETINFLEAFFIEDKKHISNYQLIHGDFHLANLLMRSSKVEAIIDFDRIQFAPLEQEIGSTIVYIDEGFMASEELIRHYLKYYKKNSNIEISTKKILMHMIYRCLYRMYRWFTIYKNLEHHGKHYTHYFTKMEKYKGYLKSRLLEEL